LYFRHKIISTVEIDQFVLETLDPAYKGVVFTYQSIALYMNFLNRKNFTVRICKEPLLTNHIVFYFTKNFYLVDEINELTERFKDAGLIEHVLSKYIDTQLMDLQEPKTSATALTMKNLSGIFQLLIYGLGVAVICFVAELVCGRVLRRRRRRSKCHLKNNCQSMVTNGVASAQTERKIV
jgi:hypothetical protein